MNRMRQSRGRWGYSIRLTTNTVVIWSAMPPEKIYMTNIIIFLQRQAIWSRKHAALMVIEHYLDSSITCRRCEVYQPREGKLLQTRNSVQFRSENVAMWERAQDEWNNGPSRSPDVRPLSRFSCECSARENVYRMKPSIVLLYTQAKRT